MPRTFLDPRVFADPSWWHWAVTVPLLAAHLLGVPGALPAALLLCAATAAHYLLRLRRWRPLPVQVRLAYLGWLLTGLLPGMQWMHYVALVGTTAMVTVGYCPLGRVLGLLGFNRPEPLGVRLVYRQLFSPPGGGLFYRPAGGPTNSCSLRPGPGGPLRATGCGLRAG
jgi:hypothetical protein